MPHRAWKHYCTASGCQVFAGSPTCSSCGATGEYDGWRLGRIEAMCGYQRVTGLAPYGEHRPLTDLILGPLLSLCPRCDGRGLLCSDEDDEWQDCPQCDGARYVRTASQEEFQATRRRILREFPAAAPSSTATQS